MALPEITKLLQRVSLDRDTKLQILAILAVNKHPRAEQDIETLLRSYDELELAERERLTAELSKIELAYEQEVESATTSLKRDILTMEDDTSRNDEIERIRQSILKPV